MLAKNPRDYSFVCLQYEYYLFVTFDLECNDIDFSVVVDPWYIIILYYLQNKQQPPYLQANKKKKIQARRGEYVLINNYLFHRYSNDMLLLPTFKLTKKGRFRLEVVNMC
jgi:hypothetical protein